MIKSLTYVSNILEWPLFFLTELDRIDKWWAEGVIVQSNGRIVPENRRNKYNLGDSDLAPDHESSTSCLRTPSSGVLGSRFVRGWECLGFRYPVPPYSCQNFFPSQKLNVLKIYMS